MEPHDWPYDDIIKALRLRGYSLAKLAEALDLTYPQVRYQIRTGSSDKTRHFISSVVGEPEWRIWPSKFPRTWREDGPPKPHG